MGAARSGPALIAAAWRGERMSAFGSGVWPVIAWLFALGLAAGVVLLLVWFRLRRVRLLIEAPYLSAVAESSTVTVPSASALFADVRGESARRLLRGLVAPGRNPGPASWAAQGWLRYDHDDHERLVVVQSYGVPGRWWAQIRRVRLRLGGWIDEMHRVEPGRASSDYWWLGLVRAHPPGVRPSALALEAQALGEAVVTPWVWFTGGWIVWDDRQEGAEWFGRTVATRQQVRLHLDALGRPASIELQDPKSGERVRVEYAGWHWREQSLVPATLRLIEAAGSVNQFVRMELKRDLRQRETRSGAEERP